MNTITTYIVPEAQAALDHGWVVFPLRADSKTPYPGISWDDYSTPVEHWPENVTGYGIDCGRSGLTVIDIDGDTGSESFDALLDRFGIEDWPNTYSVQTQGGGFHLYFAATGYRNSASKLGEKIDIRGDGGYVVGAGSVVNGKPYTEVNPSPVAPLPTWLVYELTGTHSEGWYLRTLEDLAAEVESAQEHTRNDTLNRMAFVAYSSNRIDDDDATEALRSAALACGLHDQEINATLASALNAAERKRQERTDVRGLVAPGVSQRPTGTSLAIRGRAELWTPAQSNFDFVRFSELSDEPLKYRIPGLLPMGTNVLFSAYAKSGKTTTVLSLIRGLTSSADFLDMPCATVGGRVVYVNFELTDQMLRKYATDSGLKLDNDKLRVWQLQGKASQLVITDPAYQAAFAEKLREAECDVLIIDPLAPVISMQGYKEEDNSGIRAILECFGAVGAMTELENMVIIDHTGHADKNRARAASAKLDWADVIWNQEVNGEKRSLKAWGRGIEEATITFTRNPETGQLEQAVARDVDDGDKRAVLGAIKAKPGIDSQELASVTGLTKQAVSKRTRDLRDLGRIRIDGGRGPKPASYYPVTDS
jgi:hypothetical protein